MLWDNAVFVPGNELLVTASPKLLLAETLIGLRALNKITMLNNTRVVHIFHGFNVDIMPPENICNQGSAPDYIFAAWVDVGLMFPPAGVVDGLSRQSTIDRQNFT
jgi:hypothetical protein